MAVAPVFPFMFYVQNNASSGSICENHHNGKCRPIGAHIKTA